MCGGGLLLAHAALLGVVRELATAEPSYVGQVLRWVPLLTRETLDKQPGSAAIRFLSLLTILFGIGVIQVILTAPGGIVDQFPKDMAKLGRFFARQFQRFKRPSPGTAA